MEQIAAAGIGFLIDLWLGDPYHWWHPVKSIGWLIGRLERWLRALFSKNRKGELVAGTVLVCLVLLITASSVWAVLAFAGRIHPGLRFFVMCLMSYQILAAKGLRTESMKVYEAGRNGDIEGARRAVSMIVGRDTETLDEEGIMKAAVETVAENTSDGVIAPLCFLLLTGPVGGFLYKAVNTMDSMIGYKNDKYRYFGRAAAYLDDFVNLIPARLSALLFVVAAWLIQSGDSHVSGKRAWQIWRRDRRNHASPNSAQGEAACAGALGIQLAGNAWYFGVLHEKPTIGEAIRTIEYEDIRRVNGLMYVSAFLAVLIGTGGALCYAISTGAIFTGM